jgi:hypothetical protein
METFGRMLLFAMSLTFMLLAYQVNNFTGVMGWIFGVILALAVLASFSNVKRYPGGRGYNL